MSLYEGAQPQFQSILLQGGISKGTVADMQVAAKVYSANQFLQVANGDMGKYIRANDSSNVQAECGRFLELQCGQGRVATTASETTMLATLSPLMPALADRENAAILENSSVKKAHFSEQFPSGLSSLEQKADHSVNTMIMEFNRARPGVLKPSAQPATKVLNCGLQFALAKAGHKDSYYVLTTHRPNFAKFAMKSGGSDEVVGGAESQLTYHKEGSEITPKSIGVIGKLWMDFLRFMQAVMAVQMPDGSVYGKEAGFIALEECYANYASQRATVSAVCSALNNGWRVLCDELITSNDDFVVVCKNQHKAGVWVEDEIKRPRDHGDTPDAKRIKSLERQLEKARTQGGARLGAEGAMAGGVVNSTKPCFNYFAGKPCANTPCPFRHDGPAPKFNPAGKKAGKKEGE